MNTSKTIAAQVAEIIAPTVRAAFDAAGQPITWETLSGLFLALKQELGVVSPDDERAAKRAAYADWVKTNNLRNDSQTKQALGLSGTEWQTALQRGLIRPVPVPEPYRYPGDADGTHSERWYPPLDLTDSQRAEIAENTLVRANEAASRWGMSLQQFRHEWRPRGLVPVREDPHPWFRLRDVLDLAPKR